MWNQTPLLLQRAKDLPERSGDGLLAAIRDVVGSDPVLVHVYRPDVVSQAVSFWRAVQTRVWRGRPDPVRDARAEYHAGAIAHVVTMLRRAGGRVAQLVRGGERRTDRRALSGLVAQPDSGCRHGARVAGTRSPAGAVAGAGTPGRPALGRMGGALPCRRRTRGATGMSTASRRRAARTSSGRSERMSTDLVDTTHVDDCGYSRPRPSTSSARWSPSWPSPCCCSPPARTRSCYSGWRRRRFVRRRCHFPCCTSTPVTTSTKSSNSVTAALGDHGHTLIVGSVQESIDSGRVPDPGPGASRNRQQTRTLLDALEGGGFDAAFGGARRDEERARAKERILSFRDEFGQWDPRAQRPEPWSLYNGRIRKGEQVRVFPLSNWTELDIWRYIELERSGAAVDLLRPRTRGRRARRHPAGGVRIRPTRRAMRRPRSNGSATARSAT